MADEHKKPKFWINPNSRITFPQFRVVWHQCDKQELIDFCYVEQSRRLTYRTVSACLHILYEDDYSVLYILYSDDLAFENMRLQKWLRVSIRDAIMSRAQLVLPKRLHELEEKHQLWAKAVVVQKLRKRILGQCTPTKLIRLSPAIVIFPQEMMDDVILHEMAHLKYMHHRNSFWNFLSTLLGEDAEGQKFAQDMICSKYHELYDFLMK